MALGIAKYAPCDVDVMDMNDFGKICRDEHILSKYNGISQCSWTEGSSNLPYKGKLTTWVASHGFDHEFPIDDKSVFQNRIATGLRNRQMFERVAGNFRGILCVSDRIFRAVDMKRAVRVVPGVDCEQFTLSQLPNKHKIVVGWCGQSGGTTKGYSEILEPLMGRLGDSVEWNVNTRDHSNAISTEQMIDWYRSIDVFLSTSFSEGFQMPIVEAMACGRPVIATDAGAAREILRDGINGHLVQSYTNSKEAEKLIPIVAGRIMNYSNMRDVMVAHGVNARHTIETEYDWKIRASEWTRAML